MDLVKKVAELLRQEPYVLYQQAYRDYGVAEHAMYGFRLYEGQGFTCQVMENWCSMKLMEYSITRGSMFKGEQ